ncbi:MAG: GIY-YIG nuclease family protein [Bacteroidota bacterium]
MPRPLTVYLLASRSRALYVGVTNNLPRRLAEHRGGLSEFTARYRIDRLVHVETYDQAADAIAREKQLKGWSREKKVALVERENPTWRDLDASRYGWTTGSKAADADCASSEADRLVEARRDPSTPLCSAQDDQRRTGAQNRRRP